MLGMKTLQKFPSETEKDESDTDIEQDIYNMREVAKQVSFGAPMQNSDCSDESSHGVITYGRGAEKVVSMEKKMKKSDKKKTW